MSTDLYHEDKEIETDLFDDIELDIDPDKLEEEITQKKTESITAEDATETEETNKNTHRKTSTAKKPSRGTGHKSIRRKGKARDKKVTKSTENKQSGTAKIAPKEAIKGNPHKNKPKKDPFGIEDLKRAKYDYEVYFKGKLIYDSNIATHTIQWSDNSVRINSVNYRIRQVSIVKKK